MNISSFLEIKKINRTTAQDALDEVEAAIEDTKDNIREHRSSPYGVLHLHEEHLILHALHRRKARCASLIAS